MKIGKYYQESTTKDGEPHKEEAEAHHDSHGKGRIHISEKFDALAKNKYLLISLAVIIILIDILLRMGMLQYQGLFEPDGFFYYSVIRQTIANHFVVSNYLGISGFPSHNFIGEAPGLPYLTVIGYYLLHGVTGLSALTIMRWMPILFSILYAIISFFLAKKLSNSNALGLMAMFFVSVSSGNIARTAGTIYRGDSFISLFILLSLLLMLKCFEEKKMVFKWVWAILSSVTLSLGIMVWNGSPFIIVVYIFALLLVVMYGFIKADREVLMSCVVLSITLLLVHLLQLSYVALGMARSGLELLDNSFFILYVPVLLGSIIAYYLCRHPEKIKFISATKNRILLVVVAGIVAAILMFVLFSGTLTAIALPISGPPVAAGAPINATTTVNNTIRTSITTTTQELQPPTYAFLWSSFNIQIYLSIIGVALFVLFSFLVWKGERFIKRDHFSLNAVAFLVLASYFAVTAYLQAAAIRFNAIISLPLAIFAAFGVYGIAKLFYSHELRRKTVAVVVIIPAIIISAVVMFEFYPILFSQYQEVTASLVILYIGLVALIIYCIYSLIMGNLKLKYIVLGIILIIMVYTFFNTFFESYTAVQADGINPEFLSAMTWLKNNSASNATVLALWPDGSVVEGWANRTSYMDSVGGENSSKIYPFSKFLFSETPDTQYLYSVHKPDYIIVRNFWYQELGGIAQEGLVSNATAYGYVIMPSMNITSNSTAQFFTFQSDTPPYYKSELVIEKQTNGTDKFVAYLGVVNSTRLALMRSVIFSNSSNLAYSVATTNYINDSVNYSLLISFTGTNINGAYILGPKLIQSNVFKLTFLCNAQACAYNDSNVSLNMVYANPDTKIFKINYAH